MQCWVMKLGNEAIRHPIFIYTLSRWYDLPPRPFGVKAGALAACEVRLAFFDGGCIFAGVNDGDSTLSDFLELSDCD
jgi:hypothetical protein